MSHEPISLSLDPTSTEKYTDSGVLTDDLTIPLVGVPPPFAFSSIESMIHRPFFIAKTNLNVDTLTIDPFEDFIAGGSDAAFLPWPYLTMLSYYMYDFDVLVEVKAVKHPAIRCKFMATWVPKGDPAKFYNHARSKRVIWDMEANNSISFLAKAPKIQTFRSRHKMITIPTPSGVQWVNGTSNYGREEFHTGGVLQLNRLVYDVPNVAPDLIIGLVTFRFVNAHAVEYRGIQAAPTYIVTE